MNLFRSLNSLGVAALVGVVMLGVPASARATFALYLQEAGVNGGAITMVASGTDFQAGGISFSGTYGDFTVSIFGGTANNGINGGTKSNLLSSTVEIDNNSTSSKTLKLYVSQTNYSLPTGTPLVVESGLGGSLQTGTTVGMTGIFQAWADRLNNALGMADFTNGPQNGAQTGTTFDTGSASGLFSRTTATSLYSLTSMADFVMSGSGVANYSDHVNVTTTPAPASLMLAASGVPALALGWLRRRKVKAEA